MAYCTVREDISVIKRSLVCCWVMYLASVALLAFPTVVLRLNEVKKWVKSNCILYFIAYFKSTNGCFPVVYVLASHIWVSVKSTMLNSLAC